MSISVLTNTVTVTLTWFADSPAFGSWRCICSLCGELIKLSDGPPLRVWRCTNKKGERGEEARLHRDCFVLLRVPPVPDVVPFINEIENAPSGETQKLWRRSNNARKNRRAA